LTLRATDNIVPRILKGEASQPLTTDAAMTFNYLIRDSATWTLLFFVLVALAVFTQLTKETLSKSLPVFLRAPIKAAPAVFLSGLCFYLELHLVGAGFLLCAVGDILLDLPEPRYPLAFEFGAVSFGIALIVFAVASYYKPLAGHPLRPLVITNVVIALFIIRWVFPSIPASRRKLELAYFSLLIISNFFAGFSNAAVFLGSSLWFMSDLSIGLSTYVRGTPTNSLDTLGLYDLGLYFLAIGFLNL
jgi:uncharacterized membrane protein YhhN